MVRLSLDDPRAAQRERQLPVVRGERLLLDPRRARSDHPHRERIAACAVGVGGTHVRLTRYSLGFGDHTWYVLANVPTSLSSADEACRKNGS
jgi:hypothetical protein